MAIFGVDTVSTAENPFEIPDILTYISVLITEGAYGKLTNHIITNNNYTMTSTGISQVAAEIDYNDFQCQLNLQLNMLFLNGFTVHKNPNLILNIDDITTIGNINFEGTLGVLNSDNTVTGAKGYIKIWDKTKKLDAYKTHFNLKTKAVNCTFDVDTKRNVVSYFYGPSLDNALIGFLDGSNAIKISIVGDYMSNRDQGGEPVIFTFCEGNVTNVEFTTFSGSLIMGGAYGGIGLCFGETQNVYGNPIVQTIGRYTDMLLTASNYTKSVLNTSVLPEGYVISGLYKGELLTGEQCKDYSTISQYLDINEVV